MAHFVDILLFSQDGNTALHIASSNGYLNVVDWLLSEGADINVKNNDGKTPLDVCQDLNKEEIISLFNKYNPKRGGIMINNTTHSHIPLFVVI